MSVAIAWFVLILTLLFHDYWNAPPKIHGVFCVPELPFVGHALFLRRNPAQKLMQWAAKYNQAVFQIRLGNTRVLVVNSFEHVRSMWIDHSRALGSRPVSFTFHDVVSTTQGFTIGSTPAGPEFRNTKKAVAMALNNKALDRLNDLFNEQSRYTISKIASLQAHLRLLPFTNHNRANSNPLCDIDLLKFAQYYSLRSSILIAYGFSIDCYGKDAKMADTIIDTESNIIKLRSPIANIEDYVGFLRWWPFKYLTNFSRAQYYRNQRDLYMAKLLKKLERNLCSSKYSAHKAAHSSLVGKLCTATTNALSECEIKSVCLTMVSAGLDNTSLTFNHIMGHLSHEGYGLRIQERAFAELTVNSGVSVIRAWKDAAQNTNCVYITAIVQEGLRFLSVLPLSLPRVTTADFEYNGANVAKGTYVFMNAFAANYDETVFRDPKLFSPERWLDEETGDLKSPHALRHFSFGAGARRCSGNYLAFRQLYTLVARMILAFHIRKPVDTTMAMSLDPFASNKCPLGTGFDPMPFKVRLCQRMNESSDALHKLLRCT